MAVALEALDLLSWNEFFLVCELEYLDLIVNLTRMPVKYIVTLKQLELARWNGND